MDLGSQDGQIWSYLGYLDLEVSNKTFARARDRGLLYIEGSYLRHIWGPGLRALRGGS